MIVNFKEDAFFLAGRLPTKGIDPMFSFAQGVGRLGRTAPWAEADGMSEAKCTEESIRLEDPDLVPADGEFPLFKDGRLRKGLPRF